MNQGHQALLKEVYEKKGKKMATDGQNDLPAEPTGNKVPPFMAKRGNKQPDARADAKRDAAKRRLAMMRKGK